MKTQSKLLKVISIIMIVLGILGILSNVGLMVLGNSLYEAAGIDAPSGATYVITLLVAVAELIAGILGVQYKNRQNVLIIGIVWVVLLVISTVMTGMNSGFNAMMITSYIFPILYLWGWYQSN